MQTSWVPNSPSTEKDLILLDVILILKKVRSHRFRRTGILPVLGLIFISETRFFQKTGFLDQFSIFNSHYASPPPID